MSDRGDGLGPDEQHRVRLALGNGVGKFIDQMLRTLAADLFPDGAVRMGSDPVRHGSREVVGTAERRIESRAGDLELANGGDHVDGRQHRPGRACVCQRRPGRRRRQICRGQGGVILRVDPFGRFAHADDDRCAVMSR